ncbi:hypothetical protein PCL_12476 [Purpureocillium lilacinum]|uniref:Uncharacterized protein n=1 Tax=Purpureocillium lilacinum TaxID=33203 RepID=A0A2U3E9D5_PURLI|nr:hypothetical protein PCL_12476 [Purpureocillium lilacinum]
MQTTTALETDTQTFPTKNSHARISPAASLLTRERRARHTGVAILGVCREAHLTCRTAGEIAAAKEAHRSARLPRPDGPGGASLRGFARKGRCGERAKALIERATGASVGRKSPCPVCVRAGATLWRPGVCPRDSRRFPSNVSQLKRQPHDAQGGRLLTSTVLPGDTEVVGTKTGLATQAGQVLVPPYPPYLSCSERTLAGASGRLQPGGGT